MTKKLLLPLENVESLHNVGEWKKDDKFYEAIKTMPTTKAEISESYPSIPSMFARLETIKKAFEKVNSDYVNNRVENDGDRLSVLRGTNDNCKIISECLDIGWLFWKYKSFESLIEKVVWTKPGRGIDEFANSLYNFIDQEGNKYNCNNLNTMSILKWKGTELDTCYRGVLGATSPVSMFWASADIKEIWKYLMESWKNKEKAGTLQPAERELMQANLFDAPISLYDREPRFRYFIYDICYANVSQLERRGVNNENLIINKDFKEEFEVVWKYIDNTKVLKRDHYNKDSRGGLQNGEEIIDKIYVKKCQKEDPFTNSPLKIKATKEVDKKLLPIVLPASDASFIGEFYKGKDYMNIFPYESKQQWYSNEDYGETPYEFNNEEIANRNMPGYSDISCPGLTLNDFFEDYMIESFFPIDDKKFVCLEQKTTQKENGNYVVKYFFPPIKKKYFDYFTVEDLRNNLRIQGKPIEIKEVTDEGQKYETYEVSVELTIPVVDWVEQLNGKEERKDCKVVYQKTYTMKKEILDDSKESIDNYNKDQMVGSNGLIENLVDNENNFCVTFLPFRKPSQDEPVKLSLTTHINSRLSRVSGYTINNNMKDIAKNATPVISSEDEKQNATLTSRHYSLIAPFDYLQVGFKRDNKNFSVMIIPDLDEREKPNNVTYNFGVDFGTSNTYIAWHENTTDKKKDDQNDRSGMKSLNIFDGSLCRNLFKGDKFFKSHIARLISMEFMPTNLESQGKDKETIKFPCRTVIWKNDNESEEELFDTRALYLSYEHPILRYSKFEGKKFLPDIKWKNQNAATTAIKELCSLIKDFLIQKRAKLGFIVLSYPLSMDEKRLESLQNTWKTEVTKLTDFYDPKCREHIKFISESIAPYSYAKTIDGSCHNSGLYITMDIGGGSTDIAIQMAKDNTTKVFTSSFAFAGNNLFGDYDYHGTITKSSLITKVEEEDNFGYLKSKVIDSYPKNSADFHSLFFRLDAEEYSSILKEIPEFRVAAHYFYAAILYHVCDALKKISFENDNLIALMKAGSMEFKNIILSGNGSKIINNFVAPQFTKLFMEKNLGFDFAPESKTLLISLPEPKLVTAQGAIAAIENQDRNVEESFVLYPSSTAPETVMKRVRDFRNNEDDCNSCLASVKDFHKKFIETMRELIGKISGGIPDMDGTVGQVLDVFEGYAATENNARKWRDYYRTGGLDCVGRDDDNPNPKNDTIVLAETTFFFPIKAIIFEHFFNSEKNN